MTGPRPVSSGAGVPDTFRALGLGPGSVVFVETHPSGEDAETFFGVLYAALREAVGDTGTIVTAAYSDSFDRSGTFDPANDAAGTPFGEYVRRLPDALRSADPFCSTVAVGPRAAELTACEPPFECFGEQGFWGRFLKAGGVFLGVNAGVATPFLHYAEKRAGVPYRYDRLVRGMVRMDGVERAWQEVVFAQDPSNPDTVPVFDDFEATARREKLVRSAVLSWGTAEALAAEEALRLVERVLPRRPYFLTVAGRKGRPPAPAPCRALRVEWPANASMRQAVTALWSLPRDTVSDGMDAAVRALAREHPLDVFEYPTGARVGRSLVPEKWTCHEAWLETLSGYRVFSAEETPLHSVSYSQPFSGQVALSELVGHLSVHPLLPEAVPFRHFAGEHAWGLACSARLRDALRDPYYRVSVRAAFGFGTLKVAEGVAPGHPDAPTVLLFAHLDRPGQANNGLAGAIVGIEVLRAMRERSHPWLTVRLALAPKGIGLEAYFSNHRAMRPSMAGILSLDALGLPQTHTLELSASADTPFDRSVREVFHRLEPRSPVIGRPDATDDGAPHLRLSRAYRDGELYPQYHSHLDSPEMVLDESLEASKRLITGLLERLDRMRKPAR